MPLLKLPDPGDDPDSPRQNNFFGFRVGLKEAELPGVVFTFWGLLRV